MRPNAAVSQMVHRFPPVIFGAEWTFASHKKQLQLRYHTACSTLPAVSAAMDIL